MNVAATNPEQTDNLGQVQVCGTDPYAWMVFGRGGDRSKDTLRSSDRSGSSSNRGHLHFVSASEGETKKKKRSARQRSERWRGRRERVLIWHRYRDIKIGLLSSFATAELVIFILHRGV